jgi:hypothetical protein
MATILERIAGFFHGRKPPGLVELPIVKKPRRALNE